MKSVAVFDATSVMTVTLYFWVFGEAIWANFQLSYCLFSFVNIFIEELVAFSKL